MPESDSKLLTVLFYSLIALLLGVGIWFFWPRDRLVQNPDPPPVSSNDVPESPKGPEKIVDDVFKKLGNGAFKHTDVLFNMKFDPMRGIPVTLDKRGGSHRFHGVVKFPLTDVTIASFDPASKTVKYSVRVPHPCVMFWQWDAVYPDELTRIPEGLLMKGSYDLTELNDGSWSIVVDDKTNPIALYQMVYHSVNQIWFSGMTSGGFSSELLKFVMLMLFSTYTIALDIPEDQASRYAQQWMDECDTVLPKENVRQDGVQL